MKPQQIKTVYSALAESLNTGEEPVLELPPDTDCLEEIALHELLEEQQEAIHKHTSRIAQKQAYTYNCIQSASIVLAGTIGMIAGGLIQYTYSGECREGIVIGGAINMSAEYFSEYIARRMPLPKLNHQLEHLGRKMAYNSARAIINTYQE